MASRHKFWVIMDGNTPTAFRANYKEELLPILTQLRRTQSEVSIRWFARGRLWHSPIEEHADLKTARVTPRDRTKEWRPGGEHKDPNARFEMTRDQKRARFKMRQSWPPKPSGPAGDRPKGPPRERSFGPPRDRPSGPPRDRPSGPPRGSGLVRRRTSIPKRRP